MKYICLIFVTFMGLTSNAEEYLSPVKIDLGDGILVDLQVRLSESTNRYFAIVRGLEGTQRNAYIRCESVFEGDYHAFDSIPKIDFANLGVASSTVSEQNSEKFEFVFLRNIGSMNLMNKSIQLQRIQSGHIAPIRNIKSCFDFR